MTSNVHLLRCYMAQHSDSSLYQKNFELDLVCRLVYSVDDTGTILLYGVKCLHMCLNSCRYTHTFSDVTKFTQTHCSHLSKDSSISLRRPNFLAVNVKNTSRNTTVDRWKPAFLGVIWLNIDTLVTPPSPVTPNLGKQTD